MIVVFAILFAFIAIDSSTEFNATSLERKLIGGDMPIFGTMLFVVSIRKYHKHICVGSFVSPSYVLTAAHFMRSIKKKGPNRNVQNYDIMFKQIRTNSDPVFNIINVDCHDTLDIAVLLIRISLSKLEQFYFNSEFPIDLKEKKTLMIGWGVVPSNLCSKSPYMLQQLNMTIITNEKCQKKYKNLLSILDTHICAIHNNKDASILLEDKGCPLIDKNEIVGLESFNVGDQKPIVFVRVPENKPYIIQAKNRLQRNILPRKNRSRFIGALHRVIHPRKTKVS